MSDPPEESARKQADAALLRELRDLSADAQRRYYRQFAPMIYHFALVRFAGDVPLAEDIMMQTLAEGLLNLHLFSPHRGSFSAWLYGIARRHIHDELRKQGRRKSVPAAMQLPLEAVLGLAGEGDLAEGVSARIDDQRQFAKLAKALSDLELEVLILLYVNQLDSKEISQIIGKTEYAVYSILHRARKKARERLAHDEP